MIDIKNKTKESADAYIYEEITSFDLFGGKSCRGFKDEIEALGPIKHLNLYINSIGGDVFEGLAIANFLKRQKFTIDVYVDGIAASIASAIALGCGGTVHLYDSSIIMIHKCWCTTSGNSEELKKTVEQLEECDKSIFSMYKDKINGKISDEELQEMISNETWLDAQTCLDIGFAFDIIQNENKIAAKIPSEYCNRFSNIPKNLISDESPTEEKQEQEEIPEDVKNAIEDSKRILSTLNYNF